MASSFCGELVFFMMYLYCVIVYGQISKPTFDVEESEPANLVLPNQQESLDDCHSRFYELGKSTADKPAYGIPSYLREFAHMAAIGWSQTDNSTKWSCGGSLIWENFVLTAAHCAVDESNMPPDVTRLGDIDLFNDSDDGYAQQIRILEIIRHPEYRFSARYHDIALLRLERKVALHETVAPACLWDDDEIRFKTLEATGWGDTGFAQSRTPILLKVLLRPVDREACNEHYQNIRGLRAGLHDYQMCAGHTLMDTCPGDSGGPLQVKLLHNTRITPFVVAVTSFGSACGLSVPGVYVRVAPYVQWIQSVFKSRGEDDTDWLLEPQACARKYVNLREYEPRVQLSKNSVQERLDLSKAHLYRDSSKQLVRIHWNSQMANSSNECYGVIIDESTVLTLARCTKADGISATHVTFAGNKTNTITHTYKHPDYEEGSLRNAIGVLKVKDAFEFNADFTPACVWTKQSFLESEMEVTGRGLLELNELFSESASKFDRISLSNTVDVLGVVMEQKGANCSLPKQYTDLFSGGLIQEHVCFGAEPFLVPRTCSQTIGGPLQREVFRYGRRLMYVNALNLVGRDCGFGESALAVRLAHHRRWLESVLYPPRQTEVQGDSGQVIFLNDALDEGDNCTAPNRIAGVCVNVGYCPKVALDFESNREAIFCKTGSLVCCPQRYIRSETNEDADEINFCKRHQDASSDEEEGSGEYRSASSSHVVSIVWVNGEMQRICIGTIISKRTLLTAASCVDATSLPDHVIVEYPSLGIQLQMMPSEMIIHPEFDNSTKEHNLALIKTMNNIADDGFRMLRACLWRNVTHTPFMMEQLVLADNNLETIPAHLKFNTDCRRALGRILTSSELCLKVKDLNESPVSIDDGMPVFWPKPDGGYLVGIVSRRSSLSDHTIVQYTRISSYVDWIKAVL
uniref:Peptidase S1 domain-containing protein n=1 Tax=Anopheles albimanus TaxID=7167 RepID=A0A3F2YQ77_ANOAL